jgi:hypothetical protein
VSVLSLAPRSKISVVVSEISRPPLHKPQKQPSPKLALLESPKVQVTKRGARTKESLLQSVAHNDDERLFDARVNLKVATAQYAMHLPADVRSRMFKEFDYLLESDAWDMEDTLPAIDSYRQFLRWVVFTGDTSWTSFGVADDGSLLVAWIKPNKKMTASFGERIRWTQELRAEGETQISGGNFTAEHFARQAKLFLEP